MLTRHFYTASGAPPPPTQPTSSPSSSTAPPPSSSTQQASSSPPPPSAGGPPPVEREYAGKYVPASSTSGGETSPPPSSETSTSTTSSGGGGADFYIMHRGGTTTIRSASGESTEITPSGKVITYKSSPAPPPPSSSTSTSTLNFTSLNVSGITEVNPSRPYCPFTQNSLFTSSGQPVLGPSTVLGGGSSSESSLPPPPASSTSGEETSLASVVTSLSSYMPTGLVTPQNLYYYTDIAIALARYRPLYPTDLLTNPSAREQYFNYLLSIAPSYYYTPSAPYDASIAYRIGRHFYLPSGAPASYPVTHGSAMMHYVWWQTTYNTYLNKYLKQVNKYMSTTLEKLKEKVEPEVNKYLETILNLESKLKSLMNIPVIGKHVKTLYETLSYMYNLLKKNPLIALATTEKGSPIIGKIINTISNVVPILEKYGQYIKEKYSELQSWKEYYDYYVRIGKTKWAEEAMKAMQNIKKSIEKISNRLQKLSNWCLNVKNMLANINTSISKSIEEWKNKNIALAYKYAWASTKMQEALTYLATLSAIYNLAKTFYEKIQEATSPTEKYELTQQFINLLENMNISPTLSPEEYSSLMNLRSSLISSAESILGKISQPWTETGREVAYRLYPLAYAIASMLTSLSPTLRALGTSTVASYLTGGLVGFFLPGAELLKNVGVLRNVALPENKEETSWFMKGVEETSGAPPITVATGTAIAQGAVMWPIQLAGLGAYYVGRNLHLKPIEEAGKVMLRSYSESETVAHYENPYAGTEELLAGIIPALVAGIPDIAELAGYGLATAGARLLARGMEVGATLSRIGLRLMEAGEALAPLRLVEPIGYVMGEAVSAIPRIAGAVGRAVGRLIYEESEIPVVPIGQAEVEIRPLTPWREGEEPTTWQITIRGAGKEEVENMMEKLGIENYKIRVNPENSYEVTVTIRSETPPEVVTINGVKYLKIGNKMSEIPRIEPTVSVEEAEGKTIIKIKGGRLVPKLGEEGEVSSKVIPVAREGEEATYEVPSQYKVSVVKTEHGTYIKVQYPREGISKLLTHPLPRKVANAINRLRKIARDIWSKVEAKLQNFEVRYELRMNIVPLGNNEYMVTFDAVPYAVPRGYGEAIPQTKIPILTAVVDDEGNIYILPVHPYSNKFTVSGELAELYGKASSRELITLFTVTPSGEIVPSAGLVAYAFKLGARSPEELASTLMSLPVNEARTSKLALEYASLSGEYARLGTVSGREGTEVTVTESGVLVTRTRTGINVMINRLDQLANSFIASRGIEEYIGQSPLALIRDYLMHLVERGVLRPDIAEEIFDIVSLEVESGRIVGLPLTVSSPRDVEEWLEYVNSLIIFESSPRTETRFLTLENYAKLIHALGTGRKIRLIEYPSRFREELEEYLKLLGYETTLNVRRGVRPILRELNVSEREVEELARRLMQEPDIAQLARKLLGKATLTEAELYNTAIGVAKRILELESLGIPFNVARRLAVEYVGYEYNNLLNVIEEFKTLLRGVERNGEKIPSLVEVVSRIVHVEPRELEEALWEEFLRELEEGNERIRIGDLVLRALERFRGRLSPVEELKIFGWVRTGEHALQPLDTYIEHVANMGERVTLTARNIEELASKLRPVLEDVVTRLRKLGIDVAVDELEKLLIDTALDIAQRLKIGKSIYLADLLEDFRTRIEDIILDKLSSKIGTLPPRLKLLESLATYLENAPISLTGKVKNLGETLNRVLTYLRDITEVEFGRGINIESYLENILKPLGFTRREIRLLLLHALERTLQGRATIGDFIKNVISDVESLLSGRETIGELVTGYWFTLTRPEEVTSLRVMLGQGEIGKISIEPFRPAPTFREVEKNILTRVLVRDLGINSEEASQIMKVPLRQLEEAYGRERIEKVIIDYLTRRLIPVTRDVEKIITELLDKLGNLPLEDAVEEIADRVLEETVNRRLSMIITSIRENSPVISIVRENLNNVRNIIARCNSIEDLRTELEVLVYESYISPREAEQALELAGKYGLPRAKMFLEDVLDRLSREVEEEYVKLSNLLSKPIRELSSQDVEEVSKILRLYLQASGIPPELADRIVMRLEEVAGSNIDVTLRDYLISEISQLRGRMLEGVERVWEPVRKIIRETVERTYSELGGVGSRLETLLVAENLPKSSELYRDINELINELSNDLESEIKLLHITPVLSPRTVIRFLVNTVLSYLLTSRRGLTAGLSNLLNIIKEEVRRELPNIARLLSERGLKLRHGLELEVSKLLEKVKERIIKLEEEKMREVEEEAGRIVSELARLGIPLEHVEETVKKIIAEHGEKLGNLGKAVMRLILDMLRRVEPRRILEDLHDIAEILYREYGLEPAVIGMEDLAQRLGLWSYIIDTLLSMEPPYTEPKIRYAIVQGLLNWLRTIYEIGYVPIIRQLVTGASLGQYPETQIVIHELPSISPTVRLGESARSWTYEKESLYLWNRLTQSTSQVPTSSIGNLNIEEEMPELNTELRLGTLPINVPTSLTTPTVVSPTSPASGSHVMSSRLRAGGRLPLPVWWELAEGLLQYLLSTPSTLEGRTVIEILQL